MGIEHFIGIDIGSTCAKTVVMDQEGRIVHRMLRPTGWSSVDTALSIREELSGLGVTPDNSVVVSTGYGRAAVPFAAKNITEITCHAKGACHIHAADDLTVIDIGGQDTKLIAVSGGQVVDFVMNDKCSAGTGRFLEVMANTLAVTLEDLCELARGGGGASISSMCTVFAESEVISQLSNNVDINDLVAGIHRSVAVRTAALARRLGIVQPVAMSGGVALNAGVVKALEEELGTEIKVSPLAQLNGAYGAAVHAWNKQLEEKQ